jgi:hypothetical protein
MTYLNSKGASFDSLEELMDDYRRNRTWHQKVTDCVRLPFCWYVRNPYRTASLAVRHSWQRVFRGWDDRALWSLQDHLARTLGAQLVKMAEVAYSYPGDEVYPSFEQWQTDLRRHGEALLTYQAKHYEVYGVDWDAVYVPAQEALRWVAEHFAALWD